MNDSDCVHCASTSTMGWVLPDIHNQWTNHILQPPDETKRKPNKDLRGVSFREPAEVLVCLLQINEQLVVPGELSPTHPTWNGQQQLGLRGSGNSTISWAKQLAGYQWLQPQKALQWHKLHSTRHIKMFPGILYVYKVKVSVLWGSKSLRCLWAVAPVMLILWSDIISWHENKSLNAFSGPEPLLLTLP